jgi:hypothetical protein
MKIEELCEKLGVEYEDIKHAVVVEPEHSLNKLKEFEEKHDMSTEKAEKLYWEKYKTGCLDEYLDDWHYYYIRYKHFSEMESE